MDPVVLRLLEPSDLPTVTELFDATLGSGFWSLDAESSEYCPVLPRSTASSSVPPRPR